MKKIFFAVLPMLVCVFAAAQTIQTFNNTKLNSSFTDIDLNAVNKLVSGKTDAAAEKGFSYHVFFDVVVRDEGGAETCRSQARVSAATSILPGKNGKWEIITAASNSLREPPADKKACEAGDKPAEALGALAFNGRSAISKLQIKFPFETPQDKNGGYQCFLMLDGDGSGSSSFTYDCMSLSKNITLENFKIIN